MTGPLLYKRMCGLKHPVARVESHVIIGALSLAHERLYLLPITSVRLERILRKDVGSVRSSFSKVVVAGSSRSSLSSWPELISAPPIL